MESGLPDYQAAIDDALQLVYSQHHRLIAQLHPGSFRELTLEDLQVWSVGEGLAAASCTGAWRSARAEGSRSFGDRFRTSDTFLACGC